MSFADDLVARFEPWLTPDLETYLRAWGSMMEELELYSFDVFDDDGVLTAEGWTVLFDPDLCPAPALPYLAQYVGERLLVGMTEAQQRERIKDAPNQIRGTPRAIFQAAQLRLTGNRLVTFKENDGAVDRITVVTYTSQTPNPAGTLLDIQAQVPADVILNYQTVSGQLWSDVKATYATWAAVKAANATWGQLASQLAGSSTYPG